MARTRKRRGVFWLFLAASAALGAQAAVACNTAPLHTAPKCTDGGGNCTCAEDPFQPTCKGFNERPEGGFEASPGPDATKDVNTTDTSTPDAAGDAADEASDDGGDEAG